MGVTAQDQQSRAEFERERVRHFKPGGPIAKALERYADGGYVDRRTEFAWAIWRAARALPGRGVDPMLDTPAGMEPVATVLSCRPGNDTSTIDKAIRAGTKLYTAAHALPAAEPVAGQCRFVGEAAWLGCAAEHVRSVLATPQDWEGYEVRYLYAAAPRPPATPTTEPQAPTTGAGSATAGAAQKPSPVAIAIDALASAAFVEGGVSEDRTADARQLTELRKQELLAAIKTGEKGCTPLADERIQEIDDETHFHEAPDWPVRFARRVEAEIRERRPREQP